MSSQQSELIYDWNRLGTTPHSYPGKTITFDDETLRDGLQSPSVRHPSIEEKLEILHLMEDLGIDSADIGLPSSSPQSYADALRMAQEIERCRMRLRPNCAARTLQSDIQPIVEISQRAGIAVEVCAFIGSSRLRQYAEGWNLEGMLRATEESVRWSVGHGLPTMFVTEDTTRAHPETLRRLYGCALDQGALALALCDTVGHATPAGVSALVRFVREEITAPRGGSVRLDWHGHMDRGLGVINSITAIEAGIDQIHACALGVGERVGNTPMDLLLVNLQLLGYTRKNLARLGDYCRMVSEALGVPIPINYPVFGRDAFRTGSGVHAGAVIKALRLGEPELADLVYSGVPAHWFGREQTIEVGPMSGHSNVIYWLEQQGIPPEELLVQAIYRAAKDSKLVLTDSEIFQIVKAFGGDRAPLPGASAEEGPR